MAQFTLFESVDEPRAIRILAPIQNAGATGPGGERKPPKSPSGNLGRERGRRIPPARRRRRRPGEAVTGRGGGDHGGEEAEFAAGGGRKEREQSFFFTWVEV